jgi:hypothetical protein
MKDSEFESIKSRFLDVFEGICEISPVTPPGDTESSQVTGIEISDVPRNLREPISGFFKTIGVLEDPRREVYDGPRLRIGPSSNQDGSTLAFRDVKRA